MSERLTRTHALADSPTLNEEHSQAALPKDECDSVSLDLPGHVQRLHGT